VDEFAPRQVVGCLRLSQGVLQPHLEQAVGSGREEGFRWLTFFARAMKRFGVSEHYVNGLPLLVQARIWGLDNLTSGS